MSQFKKILIVFFCFYQLQLLPTVTSTSVADKVVIFTYSYNRPDFIEIQDKTFKKFVKDDYEFIVFNDAPIESTRKKIEQKCTDLKIRCINIPQGIHRKPYLQRFEGEDWNHPSVRNSNVVQYSLDTLGFQQNAILALFDSDMFLVRDFSFVDFLKNYEFAGLAQNRKKDEKVIEYLWIGLFFIDMKKTPDANTFNFNCGKIDGINVDAGGFTHYYLRSHPGAKIKYLGQRIWPFNQCSACTQNDITPCTHNFKELMAENFDENQISFIHAGPVGAEFYQDNCFMHYRAGTNWDYRSEAFHLSKTRILHDYIERILESK